MFFCFVSGRWTLNLFRKGSKGDLTMDDLYEPLLPDKSERLADALERFISYLFCLILCIILDKLKIN